MYLNIGQAPDPEARQTVASLLLRIGALYAVALFVLLPPKVSASGDGTDQTVVPMGMKMKSLSVR